MGRFFLGAALRLLCALLAGFPLAGCTLFQKEKPLSRPNGVLADNDGSFWVVDGGNFRVVHLDGSGKLLGSFGQLGQEESDFYGPYDLAFTPDHHLVLCDQRRSDDGASILSDGLKEFQTDGTYVRAIYRNNYTE